MSGGPMSSACSRGTVGRRAQSNAVDLGNQEGKKGRGPNKAKKGPKTPDERPLIQFSPNRQFLDVEVPRLITTLWKRFYDGDYFTYELFPEEKRVQVWEQFKAHYKWLVQEEDAVRKAFLSLMKKRWSNNMKDERDKWRKDSDYKPIWVPDHLWPNLCTYWDSPEFASLSGRGKKNRGSGDRVTHTIGSVSFDVHEERMTKAVGGVRPGHQDLYRETHTMRKGVPQGEEAPWCGEKHRARHDRETMERMRTKIDHVKEEREVMKRIMEEMGRMQSCLSQQFATFNAYGMRPPMVGPSFPQAGQAFPPIGTSCPPVGPSFQHDMSMQLPMEHGIPIGNVAR
ncbi:hypothetical protein SLEP1_g17610 [Rubroshorea leprosula]|uniref:Transposase, Ptta/En/Spm, plant n=1 Tax=Rubroshorea leprosula TaxID=152421 RepID=A0AAV5J5F4_9ROSI|nr:hypothetical protein SLEP1_g17610 [Rubroshorea leprosula]